MRSCSQLGISYIGNNKLLFVCPWGYSSKRPSVIILDRDDSWKVTQQNSKSVYRRVEHHE